MADAYREENLRWSFPWLLAAVIAVGVAARIAYVYGIHITRFPDSSWYLFQASNIRQGVGYIDPAKQFAGFNGHPEQAGFFATAYWPPLYATFLAGVQAIFGATSRNAQLAGVATGSLTLLLTGLLGRAVAGPRVGLLAAAIVAFSPYAIAVDGSILSETLYVPLVLLALLLAHRARNDPTAWSWACLGATIGLAALTRSDALALIVFVFVPAAFLARLPIRQLAPRVAIGIGALALVLAPWMIRNAREVGEPTISTVSASGVIAGSNCRSTYSGRLLGYWVYSCMHPEMGMTMPETEYTAKIRREGVDFALDHASRWPLVAAAREARVWGLWDPRQLTRLESIESRNRHWQGLAWGVSTTTIVLAAIGFGVLVKRKQQIAVLVGPVLMTAFVAVATYGNTRFRAGTEPVLAIAAAVALLAAGKLFLAKVRNQEAPAGP